jgi:hypothetical protein
MRIATAVGSLASAVLWAGQAQAQGAQETLDMFRQGQGPFQCQTMSIGATTFFVPQTGDPAERFNVLGWADGTAAMPNFYNALLTQICQEGIVVAAANSAATGSGQQVEASVRAAIAMSGQQGNPLSGKVADSPRIVVSGHSQGGCGASNTVVRLDDLNVVGVNPVEPDYTFTCRAMGAVAADIRAFSITGAADAIAPANATNLGGVRNQVRGPLLQATFQGVDHLNNGPIGAGNATNRDFRSAITAFAAATLRDDARAQAARTLFDGPTPGLMTLMGGNGPVTRFEQRDAQQ